ncbi:unnamed protein product [Pylaiella littoralis]
MEDAPTAVLGNQQHPASADILVDEILRSLSDNKSSNNAGNGGSGNGNSTGSNDKSGGIGRAGESDARAALKQLVLVVQGKLKDKHAPPPARRAQGLTSLPASTPRGRTQDKCVFLKVTVVEGRAFVGELVDERTTSSALYNFSVDLQFNSQRARTRNEVRCCVEPDFGSECFAFVLREAHELPATAGAWALFLQTDLPLHVALTKHKVCRTASSNVSVAIGPNSTPPQGHPGLGREEDVGFQIMDTDEQPVPGATKKPGELVGTAEVDWRRALVPASGAQEGLHKSDGIILAVELGSVAPDSIVHPVGGILHLRLEVVAPPEVSSFPFKANDVARVMDLQALDPYCCYCDFGAIQVSVRSEARRDFYLYANAWWKDFTSTSKDLSKRSVKIFAEDERGQHRCVCSFLQPYQHGRMLPTPRHAARFVSLLPFQPRSSVGEPRAQAWNSPHAFLSAGRGDVSDHALLLCSLLLGFGLDAFVCCGLARPNDTSEAEQPEEGRQLHEHGGEEFPVRGEHTGHMWVCTFSGPRANKKAVFWESLTGQRFTMHAPQPRLQKGRKAAAVKVSVSPQHLSKVSCMFNHREFFANKQADNRVRHTSLDISNPKLWKPMDSRRIHTPGMCYPASAGPAGVVLLRPDFNTESMAEGVELGLKRRITAWREGNGWSTTWDDDLGYLLGPAVFAYEQERVCGASFGGDDFQDAVQGAVPERHCFKGYPTCFNHLSCGKMMSSLLGRTVAHDVLSSTGDHLRFALRSAVFPYPDGIMAVWLMLACRFEAPTVG